MEIQPDYTETEIRNFIRVPHSVFKSSSMLLKIGPVREGVETFSVLKSERPTPSKSRDRAPQSFGRTVGFEDLRFRHVGTSEGGPPPCLSEPTL